MTNAELLLNWLDLVWVKHDYQAGEAAFAEDAEIHNVGEDLVIMPRDYEAIVGSISLMFRTEHVELSHVIESGDEISAISFVHGHRVSDSKPICLRTHHYRKIKNGKFIVAQSSPDLINLFASLGKMPRDSLATLLMGGSLMEENSHSF